MSPAPAAGRPGSTSPVRTSRHRQDAAVGRQVDVVTVDDRRCHVGGPFPELPREPRRAVLRLQSKRHRVFLRIAGGDDRQIAGDESEGSRCSEGRARATARVRCAGRRQDCFVGRRSPVRLVAGACENGRGPRNRDTGRRTRHASFPDALSSAAMKEASPLSSSAWTITRWSKRTTDVPVPTLIAPACRAWRSRPACRRIDTHTIPRRRRYPYTACHRWPRAPHRALAMTSS